MSNIKLSAKQIQYVAKTASVDVRTLLKYLAGERVRILAGERIRAALAAAGLLVALFLLGCSDITNAPGRPDTGGAGGEVEPDAGALVEPDSLPLVEPDTAPARPDTSKPDAVVPADTLSTDTLPLLAGDTGPAMPGACAMQKVLTNPIGNGTCAKSWTGTKIACVVGCREFSTKELMKETTPCLTTGKDGYTTKDPWTGTVVCLWSWDDCDRYCTTPIN